MPTHANVTHVSLERRRGQRVGVTEDDGLGFSETKAMAARAGRAGWGLLGMRGCIEALGGELLLQSQPSQGTTVRLCVPLDGRLAP